MLSRRRMLAVLAAPAVAGLGAGCGTESSAGTGSLTRVTYLTSYGITPRETYPYVGVAKGFFRDAGIELTVLPGQPGDGNIKAMDAGKAQFASQDYVSAIRGTKTSANYRTVMAVHATTLLSILTYTDRGISGPADLAGRKYGAVKTAATDTLFPAYARKAGLDPARVTTVYSQSDQLPSLLATGRVDAIGGYATDTPNIESAAAGRTGLALPWSEFLGDLYGTVIIATTKAISDAGLTRRFVDAMATSVRFAVDNPEEAGTLVQRQVPTVKGAVVTAINKNMREYVTDFGLDEARVTRGIALLQQAGIAKPGLLAEQAVDFAVANATRAGK